jgi:hypothetical protein
MLTGGETADPERPGEARCSAAKTPGLMKKEQGE